MVGKRRIIIASLVIFLSALGVKVLSWQDTRRDVENVQSVVANDYRRIAGLLREGGWASFFNPSSPLSDPNNLGHPPGYSILLAVVSGVAGESNATVQFIQMTADALCAVLIFLIVAQFLPTPAGFLAGMMATLSPQLALNSVLLLPDSLAVFPILLSIYLITLVRRHPRLMIIVAAGALVGLSCWLRANALLLAPFLSGLCFLIFERGHRLRYATALLAGTILVLAPLTIRNAIVFRHFIPLSLGAGQTFLEGIAEYDREGKFGVPATDMGIMKWEAETFSRPDYYGTLFKPDGIWRERMRLKHGLTIVGSNPAWFLGVMTERAASMLRLERARLISAEPAVSRRLQPAYEKIAPDWASHPAELKATGSTAVKARASLAGDEQAMELIGDDSKYGRQFVSAPFEIKKDTDYVLALRARLLRGRMRLSVESVNGVRAFTIIETEEMKSPEEQPERLIQIPFVSGRNERAQLVIANEAPRDANPVMQAGAVRLFALGAARNTWTRIPRSVIHALQKFYITAVMLPLAIFGIIMLMRRRAYHALAILLVVPVYYLSIQSATHTEYRYVLSLNYFLLALAAISIHMALDKLWRLLPPAHLFNRLPSGPWSEQQSANNRRKATIL